MMGPGDFGSDPWDEFLARYFGRGEGGRRPAHRVDITRLMTADAREMLADAARRAAQRHSNDLDTDHLLWAALQREPLRDLVRRAGADPDALVNALGGRGDGAPRGEVPPNLSLTPAAKRALLDAHQLSRAMGANYIGPEHILMALPLNPESPAGRMLAAGRIQPESLQAASAERGPMGGPKPDRGTPTLDQYGQDLTDLARNDQIDPVIGRADEIEQAVEILSRRTKNNPVLIGEAGVGKTAIVEGLAERICDGDVPQTLLGKRVVQLDLAGLVAGTRYRGDFEERLKKVIDEIRAHRDELIIFLDEIHTLVGAGGAGSEGGMDASNMLKPALARGELRVIGATTLDEYRKSIEKDAALARRFQPVLVPEPSVEDTVAILRGLRDRYEAHHQVRFTDEALVAAAELSDRYVTDRFLPDKAIDLIDQAGARVRLRTRTPAADVRELEQQLDEVRRDKEQAVADEQYERASTLRDRLAELEEQVRRAQGDDGTSQVPSVGPQEIAEVVSRATGIPVSQLTEEERDRLLRLEGQLHEKVVGQDDAVSAVAEAVRRSRTGLADPNRPMGSFLFLGPTGVGKTELARALAEALFGEADRMVRVDMSEFQERHTVARLVGAPPGYVGYEEAGQLTEAVRRRPYAVVLLDEIEKAHPDVFNILLQVLDDGRLTDSQGRTVNFKNTVLIMTSNLGSELITGTQRAVGFGAGEPGSTQESDELRERLMRRLQENFRPEFLNRIDETIIFRRLEAQQLRQITELLLEETRRRLHAQDVQADFTTAGVDWLAEHGYQPEFGARPLRRVIQREVDNRLSRMLLENQLAPGQKVTVDARDGQLAFEVGAGERGYTAASTSHPR
ncbi:ATP-dependent Clp protease ATP-binding subunit [Micromonospora sp. NPDC047548]|uniref:ATP-dependent Clp protease ATP-binding subunit n=1 Tax=Micromonospora sp. NPDC047548 TaxID=3155624 RepID=UPI0033CB9435